jgi:hypothetical protein
MKITTAYCDVHPTVRLVEATIVTISPLGDRDTMNTLRCWLSSCHRNYTPQFGYFDVEVRTDYGNLDVKPRCGMNHAVEYMALTVIDGEVVWACPNAECNVTQPYWVGVWRNREHF